jgi:hypothetical protein
VHANSSTLLNVFYVSTFTHSPQPVGAAFIQVKCMHHKALNLVRVWVQVAVLHLLRTNLQKTAITVMSTVCMPASGAVSKTGKYKKNNE